MRPLPLLLALAAAAAADDGLVERWEKPRRESFDLRAAAPAEAAAEVAKRFGVPMNVGTTDPAPRDFVAADLTFFEALDRLAAAYGLAAAGAPVRAREPDGPRPLLLARPQGPVRGIPPAYLGASRLSVQSVSVITVAPLAPAEEEAEVMRLGGFDEPLVPGVGVRLRWIVEPGFEGIAMLSCEVTAAEADVGGHLEQRAEGYGNLPVPANCDFIVALDGLSPEAKAIRKLAGTVRVAIPLGRERLEFAADEVGRTKAIGAAKVTLDRLDAATKTVEFTMRDLPCADLKDTDPDLLVGSSDDLWSAAWRECAIRVLLYDAKGREIERGENVESSREGSKWTCKIQLKDMPARIAIDALVRAAVREATFSFKDIPLRE